MMRLIETRESEQRFQDLSENALTGISIVQKGRVIYRNREMKRLLNNAEHPPDRFLLENVHPGDVEKFQAFFDRLSSGKTRTANMEFRFLIKEPHTKRMSVKWVYCRATIITYRGEDAILVNIMDITRVKEIDARLRIQDKMASLGRVAAGIAHEIRNPLSGINIYLNILEKQNSKGAHDEKISEIIKNVQSASNKIESVIKRVMDFSKPGEPRLIADDINRPLLEAMDLSSVSLRKNGIELLVEIDENLPTVLLNAQLIEELVLNLIVNAVDAMKHADGAKKITISSSRRNGDICVSIADSGPGIPDHLKEKIFEPFYTTKHDSSGIGLSICQRIAVDHEGTLEVKSGPCGGTEFILKIPITEGDPR